MESQIINIGGARPNLPNFPLIRGVRRHPEIELSLVHAGQHYEERLSDVFFRRMGIPGPDVNLGELGLCSSTGRTRF